MAVGTDTGEIFIVDGSDLKATVASACPGEAIESIAPHGKVRNTNYRPNSIPRSSYSMQIQEAHASYVRF